jgi:hypothetical protein
MTSFQIDATLPELTPAQSLTGWRRELGIELFGEGRARIFLRTVPSQSMKAADLQRAILFHRVGANFRDLEGCVAEALEPLERLVQGAVRQTPSKANLFAVLEYDRSAWDAVVRGIERWERQCCARPISGVGFARASIVAATGAASAVDAQA